VSTKAWLMVDESVAMHGPCPPHLLSSARGATVDRLTEVWLEAILPCWPRRGQCRGAIAGIRECANACSRVSSLPRLWRRPPETHVGGVLRCEPLIFIIFSDLSPARQACRRDRRYTGVCQRTLSCVISTAPMEGLTGDAIGGVRVRRCESLASLIYLGHVTDSSCLSPGAATMSPEHAS
jgi:hypothetical protein